MPLDYDTDRYDAGLSTTYYPTILIMIRVVMMLVVFHHHPAYYPSYLITAPEIRICDEELYPAYCPRWIQKPDYTERHRNRDSWVLKYPDTRSMRNTLSKGGLYITLLGTSVYALIIKQIDATRDTITVSGQ